MPVRVSVPATSANLGPAFDSIAAVLALRLELLVEEADGFSIDADIDVPLDRSNLLVQAFERVMPADRFAFRVESAIPLCGGLGSSACAALAGVLAARALGGKCDDPLALAIDVDGVADNATAAYHGGITVHVDGVTVTLEPPEGISAIVVAPRRSVDTAESRAVLPSEVPIADAVANAGFATLLGAGIATGDAALIAAGLDDRIHQPRRAALYPESFDLLDRVRAFGAIGATISGSGSAVLVWVEESERDGVEERLGAEVAGWATVIPTSFDSLGATVDGEPVGGGSRVTG